ncbi:MAG: hypothetical protein KDB61_04625 [Planctomycetes bacterium]|nr:hypothetical protein [Planctomycetota bacterium]
MQHRFWAGIALAFAVLGLALAPQAGAWQAGDSEWSFEDLLERDKDYAFPSRAAQAAMEVLSDPASNADRIETALYTLGETQAAGGLPLVEPFLTRGTPAIRQAALTAWAMLAPAGAGEDPRLVSLLNDAELEVAECALFALYLNSPRQALDRIAFLIANPKQPLAPAAEHILQWHERGTVSSPGPVSRRLQLRWKSARDFGTVRGKVWSAFLLDNLGLDTRFVDRSLLFEVGSNPDPRVADHLLEWLLMHPVDMGPPMGALLGIPGALDRLVKEGMWAPRNQAQMESILNLAESRGLMRNIPETLSVLALEPKYTMRVSGWLVAANPGYGDGIEGNLISPDAATRAMAVRAAGQAAQAGWVPRLREMSRDADPYVRIEALIARVRGGDRELAWRPLRGMFLEERAQFSDAERERVLESMLAARDARVLDLAGHIRAELEPGLERDCLSTILLLGGRSPSSDGIRARLTRSLDSGFWSLKMIEALGKSHLHEDRLFLEGAFPNTNSYAINLALANSLLAHSSEKIIPLLKITVWQGDFNRSSLAAILVAERYGPLRLMQWLERPPEGVGPADLRRVGFTVGSLGGKEALDLLSKHLGAAAGAERPELQGALLGVLSARTY